MQILNANLWQARSKTSSMLQFDPHMILLLVKSLINCPKEQEPSDIKDLAAFARRAMDSETEKKDMSKASAEFALALLAGLSIEVKLDEPETRDTE